MSFGILSFGAYIPRLRLQRAEISGSNNWFNPSAKAARGERAMANWDEDAITMAVEAARDALDGLPHEPQAVHFASTSHPFDDRQNSSVVVAALDLPSEVRSLDLAASQRAGTSGLVAALTSGSGPTLLVASDRRRTKASSSQELTYGDGAAALLVGEGEAVATLAASYSETVDFVDHYRGHGVDFDYGWEERWVREEGWLKFVPRAVKAVLDRAGVTTDMVDHVVVPAFLPKIATQIAKATGVAEDRFADPLGAVCGDTGVAHPLLMLVHALERAKPGQRILVIGFGQGVDALLFETTPALEALPKRRGVTGSLARRRAETSYTKYLAFQNTMELERGMRAEIDKATQLSSLYRNRRTVLGLVGGRCEKCGTAQFPKSGICVNPNCREINTQQDYRFADQPGRVMSFTADMLTYTMDPPQHFGMVEFEGGGRMMTDFTDVDAGHVGVGQQMRMVFRVKDYDTQRGFTRYFWKATPAAAN